MSKDRFKDQFAGALAGAFREQYTDVFESEGDSQIFNAEFIYENLEKPKDPKMGRFAFPVFRYARLLGDKPQDIAPKVAQEAEALLQSKAEGSPLVKAVATGGFINAVVDFESQATQVLEDILVQDSRYADSKVGAGRKYLVEYSSPNIAKPFGVGHLRTTVIGNSLRRIYKKLGYDVVGINFLGDWGTQFGKMIVAYRKWGKDLELDNHAVKGLLELYVRFHAEAENDESLNDEAREAFRSLEQGDTEHRELWERLKLISIEEFQRVYDLLGVEFDVITGESFLNDKMNAVVERLDKVGLTRVSEGALVVDLEDTQLPPLLLKKADGATLYATRDLAGLIHRWETYRFHESLYVVATAQSDHFKQAFKTIAMLEEAENLPEKDRMSGRVKHVDFGWVKFHDQSMSTRRGNIIFLEDVIDKAVSLAREKIVEKNPSLKAIDETAHMIGVGAVIFSQLSVRRLKDVNFDWDEVLSFGAETGPYLQYTHARLCSLVRNYPEVVEPGIKVELLDLEEEQRVIELLADFPIAVADAARVYDPHLIAAYLLRLAGAFNRVYQRKDDNGKIDKIISDDKKLSAARMALVKAVLTVIKEGLYLLGLKAPREM